MARYLRQTNGDIYVWSELLSARDDMQEIDDPFVSVVVNPKPAVTSEPQTNDARGTDSVGKKPTR